MKKWAKDGEKRQGKQKPKMVLHPEGKEEIEVKT